MVTKQYYSISEVEQLLKIPSSTLRFWETKIDKFTPKRSKGSTRQYSNDDLETIKQIKYLTEEKHLSLEGVNEQLNKKNNDTADIIKLINRLEKIKKNLKDILFELKDKDTFTEEFTILENGSNNGVSDNTTNNTESNTTNNTEK